MGNLFCNCESTETDFTPNVNHAPVVILEDDDDNCQSEHATPVTIQNQENTHEPTEQTQIKEQEVVCESNDDDSLLPQAITVREVDVPEASIITQGLINEADDLASPTDAKFLSTSSADTTSDDKSMRKRDKLKRAMKKTFKAPVIFKKKAETNASATVA